MSAIHGEHYPTPPTNFLGQISETAPVKCPAARDKVRTGGLAARLMLQPLPGDGFMPLGAQLVRVGLFDIGQM